MQKQLIVITQAELHGLKYGQDLVTDMSKDGDAVESLLIGATAFIDTLIDDVRNGRPIQTHKLESLRDTYIKKARHHNDNRRDDARVLWRHMQDEENRARYENEITRGVNR